MIYLRIKGGLGNQLFEYAAGYYLSKQRNMDLCLDYSRLKAEKTLGSAGIKKEGYSYREVQLEHFCLEKHKSTASLTCYMIDRYLSKLNAKRGFSDGKLLPVINDNDTRTHGLEALKSYSDAKNIILSGYWQDIGCIEPIRESLFHQFKLNLPKTENVEQFAVKIQTCESIGVHVRRGDFVVLGLNKDAEYYITAINVLREKIPDARFFIFSDDQPWVREHLIKGNEGFVQVIINEDHSDLKEFDLLRKCKHQIISNSTFGWWAAYQNENANKIVVAPKEAKGNIWMPEWKRV